MFIELTDMTYLVSFSSYLHILYIGRQCCPYDDKRLNKWTTYVPTKLAKHTWQFEHAAYHQRVTRYSFQPLQIIKSYFLVHKRTASTVHVRDFAFLTLLVCNKSIIFHRLSFLYSPISAFYLSNFSNFFRSGMCSVIKTDPEFLKGHSYVCPSQIRVCFAVKPLAKEPSTLFSDRFVIRASILVWCSVSMIGLPLSSATSCDHLRPLCLLNVGLLLLDSLGTCCRAASWVLVGRCCFIFYLNRSSHPLRLALVGCFPGCSNAVLKQHFPDHFSGP